MHDRTGTWIDYLGLPPTPDVQPHDQRLVKLLEELKKTKYWPGRCRAVYEAVVGKRTWDHFHIFKNISDVNETVNTKNSSLNILLELQS